MQAHICPETNGSNWLQAHAVLKRCLIALPATENIINHRSCRPRLGSLTSPIDDERRHSGDWATKASAYRPTEATRHPR